MKICLYHTVNTNRIPGYDKFVQAITADNFTQADVRKIDTNLYRARLNIRDRLLFSFYRYNDETVCLVLEYLPNHTYHASRFIRQQVVIDEDRLLPVLTTADVQPEPISYINPTQGRFYRLDKMLSFDDDQQALYAHPLPLVIVGSAGSGKTALVLEKMKQAAGEILYLSLSSFLVEKARALYTTSGEANESQQIDFLSLGEFLETLSVPEGTEVTFSTFNAWLPRNKTAISLGSAHTLFEEFRGVIGASVSEGGPLSREAYLALGIKQSLYPTETRGEVYTLFERYMAWLTQSRQFDTNLLSHQYLSRATPRYDFIFIDEIQDMTPIQLFLVLKTLRTPDQFLLCGDANQVVHPNFFSWSKLKSLFFRHHQGNDTGIRILQANYRNAPHVTTLANRLLHLKQTRFGSIDRESHFFVKNCGQAEGVVSLLEDSDSVKKDLNEKTARSTRVAVVVMHPEQKEQARRWFKTPLVFSVQEAKGLEYETVILFNMVSEASKAFDDICDGVSAEDLEGHDRHYARPRNKQDRSAEIYKFFINALYVAITRATHNVYLIEQRIHHPLWSLLALSHQADALTLSEDTSSLDEWQKTASQLERQGKQEQAKAIREQILQQQNVPWQVIDTATVGKWSQQVIAGTADKNTQLQALEYSLVYSTFPVLNALYVSGFKPARQHREKSLQLLEQKYFRPYTMNNPVTVMRDIERYGVDHRTPLNVTPLMIAARMGNVELVQVLIDKGATLDLTGNDGLTACHHVLSQAITTPRYARHKSAPLYQLLKPESLSLQVEGRLIKLDGQHMPTFLLMLMQALFYTHLGNALVHREAFSAALLADCVAGLPVDILPERRKRQSYISGLLSQHEVTSAHPYNKKLFLRLRRGQYVLNPGLKLRKGDQWVPLYTLLSLNAMAPDMTALLKGYIARGEDTNDMLLHYAGRIDEIMAYWVDVIRKAAE